VASAPTSNPFAQPAAARSISLSATVNRADDTATGPSTSTVTRRSRSTAACDRHTAGESPHQGPQGERRPRPRRRSTRRPWGWKGCGAGLEEPRGVDRRDHAATADRHVIAVAAQPVEQLQHRSRVGASPDGWTPPTMADPGGLRKSTVDGSRRPVRSKKGPATENNRFSKVNPSSAYSSVAAQVQPTRKSPDGAGRSVVVRVPCSGGCRSRPATLALT